MCVSIESQLCLNCGVIMDDFWVIMGDFWVIMDDLLVSLGEFKQCFVSLLQTDRQTSELLKPAIRRQKQFDQTIVPHWPHTSISIKHCRNLSPRQSPSPLSPFSSLSISPHALSISQNFSKSVSLSFFLSLSEALIRTQGDFSLICQ